MAKGKFPGVPGNMNNMLKQVQKMQKQMEEMQKDLEQKEVETSAGGGAVTVKANGKKEIVSIKIQPEVIDPDDIEMLEDLIMAATNEALRKADEMMTSEMGKITGGMNLPGLF
jgi:DNA-binding YbaB/EbfC family protein